METLSTKKVELFDGDESLYYNKEVSLLIPGNDEIKFNTNAFNPDNRLKYLELIMGRESFLKILQSGNFKGPIGVTGIYMGTFDLSLYFLLFGEHVAVFAAGEKQPTRFMIYLEGVWKIT